MLRQTWRLFNIGALSLVTRRAYIPLKRISLIQRRRLNLAISHRFYSASSTTGNKIPDEVANLPLQTYHQESDKFLDDLLDKLEFLSEKYPNEVPDIELNHGVMTLEVAKIGTYVINKQPPNKQIWLASPVSGPDRFDFYRGDWISLRNNLKLRDVLHQELKEVLPSTETFNFEAEV
ncbi:hypothetical protein KAFR_0A06890 [Kazachstania africana CBS 2517]|uniref:ferroxidase n=1 Tax=Kazachstania africana (strain ATCC 22294 / BCRC 22015 / CBS 2517 / CECT 1963 / NBRC 1671 / NRRL Y-8276) TaxID=1071382 RepID=H2AP24_KAZAF|nr:hypothetical protein KAFR_0A06890 [Kazachstania africana CBS 2517]CCF56124.1 hypothetical protein KAFR_0A06890 [Kazachstania africana CBS 2517]